MALDATVDRLTAALTLGHLAIRIAIAAIGVIVLLIGLVGYLALQVKTVLHITQIDPDGKVLYTGAPGSVTLTDHQIQNTLQDWILACRWRTDDPVIMQLYKEKCLALTDQQAQRDMEGSFKRLHEEQLRTRSNPIRVKVEHFSRGKEGPLYRQWWTETWTPRYGGSPKVIPMSAILTVEVRSSATLFGPVLTVGDLQRSPTGVFITEVHWVAQEDAS